MRKQPHSTGNHPLAEVSLPMLKLVRWNISTTLFLPPEQRCSSNFSQTFSSMLLLWNTAGRTLKFFVCCLMLLLVGQRLTAQPDHPPAPPPPDSTDAGTTLLTPHPIPSGELRTAVGGTITILPRIVVEEELRQVPMLNLELRYGLPLGFAGTGRFSSNVITNLASVGAEWRGRLGRFSASAGYSVAYWYGFAAFEGFAVDAQSWLTFPAVSAGFDFDDFHLSGRAELQFVTSRSSATEGIETGSDRNALGGYAFTAAIEQPFWGATSAIIGLKVYYSRSMYQSWLAFSTFNEFLFYPEFQFGVIL
ncbi:MAG: hypothetical protein JNJ94_11830 [Chlorobi bacterium]|nr:hypothetical protein [Chlorobiota bacterium]